MRKVDDSLIGRRVKIISLSTKERTIRKGSRGTVQVIDDAGTIHVHWDNGRNLGLLPADKWRLLPR
jgi:hypothetical protein